MKKCEEWAMETLFSNKQEDSCLRPVSAFINVKYFCSSAQLSGFLHDMLHPGQQKHLGANISVIEP